MDGLKKDLLYALRMLSRERGTTLLVVLSLALGIGATTAIFSAIRGSLLADPPYRDAGELVMVWVDNEHQGIRTDITSYPTFEKTREQTTKLEDLGVYRPLWRTLSEGEPERVRISQVGANSEDRGCGVACLGQCTCGELSWDIGLVDSDQADGRGMVGRCENFDDFRLGGAAVMFDHLSADNVAVVGTCRSGGGDGIWSCPAARDGLDEPTWRLRWRTKTADDSCCFPVGDTMHGPGFVGAIVIAADTRQHIAMLRIM